MTEKQGLPERLYRRWAARKDKKYGGISVDGRRETRFRSEGAEAVQSSDYRCLRRLFRGLKFTEADVLADVGCGEGRVLTWLAERHFPGRMLGIELDPEAAETARRRTAALRQVEILQGSILEADAVFAQATVYYLFNPFNGKLFSKFIGKLERECLHPVTLIYLFDYYGDYLNDRPGWTCLREETVHRPGQDDAHGRIWRYAPKK